MNGIEELVGGDPRPHQTPFNSVEQAQVASYADGQVSVIVFSYRRDQSYATVPFIKKTSGDPSSGDPAVLHSDSDGHPVYAVVLA